MKISEGDDSEQSTEAEMSPKIKKIKKEKMTPIKERKMVVEDDSSSCASDADVKPNTKLYSSNSIGLTGDDELYFLTCPKNFDMNLLQEAGMLVPFETFASRGSKASYKLHVVDNSSAASNIFLANSKGSILSFPLKGTLQVVRNIANIDVDTGCILKPECQMPTFPNNLTQRHPLLGVDWSNAVEDSAQNINNYWKRQKRTNKSKEGTREKSSYPADQEEDIKRKKVKSHPVDLEKGTKKKRKIKEEEDRRKKKTKKGMK